MIVHVVFPDDVTEFEARLLVWDALSSFVSRRRIPTIEASVEREYPAPDFSDKFRASKLEDRRKRIGWAQAAKVISDDDWYDLKDIPRYTE